jgi:uncharacterized protein
MKRLRPYDDSDVPDVVFDTVIFVRALLNRRSVWTQRVFDAREGYTLCVSPPIVREILEVIARPELTHRFEALPERNAAAVIGMLRDAKVVTFDESSIPRVCRDPKDDKFLATAHAANASVLVSEDKDLLDLQEYEGVVIIDALAFLAHIRR